VKPAGPAQAAVQAAEAPLKAGSPVPVKPDPASAASPHLAKPATPAEAAARAVPGEAGVDATQAIMPADLFDDVTQPRPAKAAARGIRLIGPGGPITLGAGSFVVGRSAGSDVRLDDRQVSRSHARITIDAAAAFIEDLQTVNGTLVNGREVKARQRLSAGDIVQFGASQFRVELV
jgi:pSer/pThr/pTyr-binding forkhead associated (FHA) protein